MSCEWATVFRIGREFFYCLKKNFEGRVRF